MNCWKSMSQKRGPLISIISVQFVFNGSWTLHQALQTNLFFNESQQALINSPHKKSEVKVTSVEQLTSAVFGHNRCANRKNFVENVVEKDFAKRNASCSGHALELISVRLRQWLCERSLERRRSDWCFGEIGSNDVHLTRSLSTSLISNSEFVKFRMKALNWKRSWRIYRKKGSNNEWYLRELSDLFVNTDRQPLKNSLARNR